MFKHLAFLMDENNGEGNDLNANDRGDNLETAEEIAAREAKAAEEKAAADAKAAEEAAAAEELAAKAAADKEEQARDEKGKFAKKDKSVPDHVPKDRFDEAVLKERQGREAAERRAAELEAQVAAQTKAEEKSDAVKKAEDAIEKLEAEHAQLILDGEVGKAAAKMKEIRHAVRDMTVAENASNVEAATSAAVEQVRFDAVVARLKADYPQLRNGSDEFDEDLVNFVLSEHMRLMETGKFPMSVAMSTAAERVMKKFQPAKAADPEGEKNLEEAARKKSEADRKAEQVKKNLDTAARQPASMRDVGKDSDKSGQTDDLPDIDKLNAEEIAALPKATLARMRGDFV